ncbi:HAD family hydrolase [Butyrivibrio sp. AD3002]|uniref:HAD family hydrolase n=1 Tax=Butyrivibrio sp. AD3002 TaxID=1280670 RepID=UPI0003B4F8BF|nr:HAD family hydrolase [Butyrivibrio sp. AD3002]
MKAVIFDMDGTILDSLDDLRDSVNHALRENGLPERSTKEVRAFLGKGMVYLVNKCVPEGTDPETESRVLAMHKEYYPLHCTEKTKPYPGICELLRSLKDAGIKTAVVSNKTDENVHRLAKSYFDGLFTVAVGAREGVPRKPSPELVDIALSELGVSKSEAVYVGDSDIDVATAKNSELSMVTVLWGFRDKPELIEAGAELFAKDTEELKEILLHE